jgi:hypothetical protein
MNNFASTLCLVILSSAIFPGSSTPAAAHQYSLNGTYTLDEADSDNISAMIEVAVRKLNFLTRPIAQQVAEERR